MSVKRIFRILVIAQLLVEVLTSSIRLHYFNKINPDIIKAYYANNAPLFDFRWIWNYLEAYSTALEFFVFGIVLILVLYAQIGMIFFLRSARLIYIVTGPVLSILMRMLSGVILGHPFIESLRYIETFLCEIVITLSFTPDINKLFAKKTPNRSIDAARDNFDPMRRIENFMNWQSDIDWVWWPVVSIRPPKERDIDNRILLKMTSVFGPITGLLPFFLIAFHHSVKFTATNAIIFAFFGCIVFFVLSKFTFTYFWNRRARRLRGSQA